MSTKEVPKESKLLFTFQYGSNQIRRKRALGHDVNVFTFQYGSNQII